MNACKPRFDHIRIAFTITDRLGKTIHTGKYWLDDAVERIAFGQRCHEAIRDGYIVISCRDLPDVKNAEASA
jgi:hypothetical protein